MVREYNRRQRLSQEIQKEIAIIFQRKIKDPRIGMITISKVEMSSDLSCAKVFVTFLNFDLQKQIETKLYILKHATNFVRNLLSKAMYLRILPKLVFYHDVSFTRGIHLINLIEQEIKKQLPTQ